MMTPLYLTVSAACARWSCGRTTLYRLISEGRFSARKLGNRTLVDVGEGDAYFAALPTLSGTARLTRDLPDATRG